MSNKKSVDAKAYINAKVNDMRQAFKWADKSEKQALIDTFRADVSSPEYQENLQIVHDDSKIIREYLKRKKWWTINSHEFKDGKTQFYGKNMDLEFNDAQFESLNKYQKIQYLFDKYWDGDKTLWLILDMADKWHWDHPWKRVWDTDIEKWMFDIGYWRFNNLSLSSAKRLMSFYPFYGLLFQSPDSFKEWVYNDENLIRFVAKWIATIDTLYWTYVQVEESNTKSLLSKMTSDSQKKLVSHIVWYGWYWAKWLMSNFIYLNLWEWIDTFDYIISEIVENIDDKSLLNIIQDHSNILNKCSFNKKNCDNYVHEKKIVDALIEVWKKQLLRDNIRYFKHLSDIEKAEIMDNSEEEMKLKQEKFDKDLEILKWLWQELWFEIQVNNTKEQIEEPAIQNEEQDIKQDIIDQENTTKKRKFNLFGRKK